jgi:plastocyanin
MNKFITFCLVFFSQIVFSQTITNQGMNFSPDTITINLGDTVNFVLGNSHNAVEVSQSTFLSNGSTSNGGFNINFGQTATFIPQFEQSYYYVCQPHVNSAMKGVIIVEDNSPSSNCIDSSLINPMCICPFIYAPVCACNGLVYSNSCLAQCDGNSIIGPVDPTLVPGQSCSLSSCEVTIIGDSMPCVFPYTLEALSSGSAPFTYNWTFAGTNTNAGSTSNLFTVPNYYSGGYCVSVTDVNGCVDSACINISALPMIVNSNPNPPIVCQGELLQLSVDDLSLTNVNWIWPLTSLSNPLNLYPNNDSCYFAEAIDANGCLRSGFICIEVDSCFSSINNVNEKITIYPNPAVNQINFKFTSEKKYIISLLELTGKLVEEVITYNTNFNLNVESYRSGIYILKIESNDSLFFEKIIISKK